MSPFPLDEEPPQQWQPIDDAPQSRSVRIKLRDGSTQLVTWRWEHGGPPSGFWDRGDGKRGKVWGWFTRDGKAPIDVREIVGYREADETL